MKLSIIPWTTISASILVGGLLTSWAFMLLKAHTELTTQVHALSIAWEQTQPQAPVDNTFSNAYPLIALTDGSHIFEDYRY